MPDARILIVEDEGILALDMQQRLTSLGYPIPDIASTGREAIQKATEGSPDLILMDIMLPGEIDGVTAAERIHTLFDIPIIYITAYADEDTLRRAKITEPYGYIVKPFRERELHITIDMALYKSKIEGKLKESEKRWATTLKSIGDAVIATDRSGFVTFMNAVAERLMGWKFDEIQDRRLTDVFNIINRDTRRPVENPVTRVLLEGAIVGLANHTLLINRNGGEIPIDDSAAPIKDDQGNIVGVILVFRDITERDRADQERETAEKAVLRAKEEWERTFNTIPDLIAILDKEHRVVRVNKAMADRLGLPPDRCIGARCYEVVHGLSHPPEFCPHSLTCRDGREHVTEVHEEILGGEFLVSTTPICDEQNRFTGSIHVARNITERKRMEEELRQKSDHLEAANRELEAFTYSVSHDLRQPLRAIASFSQIVQKSLQGGLREKEKGYLARVIDNTSKITNIIEDLLRLSRVSRQEIKPTQIDMTRMAATVVSEIREAQPARCADITIGAGLTAVADQGLMALVLGNLIGNAWKFTARTENACIDFGATDRDDETVYFVRDNGVGFDLQYAKNMFKPFHRLHSESEFEGTGIGLSIVERIINRHSGKVWAEGGIGKGATVFFTLPRS